MNTSGVGRGASIFGCVHIAQEVEASIIHVHQSEFSNNDAHTMINTSNTVARPRVYGKYESV